MTSISPVTKLILDFPPSCIAFCPSQPDHFIVGTYYLHAKQEGQNGGEAAELDSEEGRDAHEEEQQKRSGSLILYRVDGDIIVEVATEPTPEYSILDIQWTPHTTVLGDLLAVATSTGSLVFYRLSDGCESRHLLLVSKKQICEISILVLSLLWHPKHSNIIAVTLSDGRVCLCEVTQEKPWDEDAVVRLVDIQSHSLEAWTVAFSTAEDEQEHVFSGGDDMVLQRSTGTDEGERTVLWQDRKIHQAGVTAILPLTSQLVLTGSYDDHIRLISAPSSGRRRIFAEAHLGGGVWRLKLLEAEDAHGAILDPSAWSGTTSLLILASCMHVGTRVVRLSRNGNEDESWSFEVLGKFEEHKSMNYGSDVLPGDGRLKTIVSTSFYDKLMCLWRFDMAAEPEV